MTKIKLFFLFLFSNFLILTLAQAEVTTSFWQTTKSQHFIIYYQELKSGFVNELVNKAENYYQSILENLGFRRFDFWSWDNRAKIYLYPDQNSYLADNKRFSWSGGEVNVKERTIKTFIGQETFFDSILPHEMTHIIFREFVGIKTRLPLWLDEGVACSQEKTSLTRRMEAAKNLVRQNMQIDLKRLFEATEASLLLPNVFYAESASVIVFLIDKYGNERFQEFSRKLRDGLAWREALLNTYRFESFMEMENTWKDFMLDK